MKIKVKELIEKYDIPRKETLEILSELGIEVKTVSSSISSSDAERFAEKIKGSKSPKKGSEKKEKKPKKAAAKEPKRANSIIGNENKPVGTLEMTVMQFDANLTKEPPKEKKKSSDDEAKKTVVADKTEIKKEDIKAKASKTEAKWASWTRKPPRKKSCPPGCARRPGCKKTARRRCPCWMRPCRPYSRAWTGQKKKRPACAPTSSRTGAWSASSAMSAASTRWQKPF